MSESQTIADNLEKQNASNADRIQVFENEIKSQMDEMNETIRTIRDADNANLWMISGLQQQIYEQTEPSVEIYSALYE